MHLGLKCKKVDFLTYYFQGSVSEPGDGTAIGSAVVATFMGCGSGGVTTLFVWKFFPGGGGDWSLEKTINGCLAGIMKYSVHT